MLSPTVSELLGRLASQLRTRFGSRVREVVLFGSHARGDAHEESDVDVLVVVDALSDAERDTIIDLAYDLDLATKDPLGVSVFALSTDDAVRYRATGRRIWSDIAREGVPL